jgi:hypothetical protein
MLPTFLLNALGTFFDALPQTPSILPILVFSILLTLILVIVTIWGSACILLVGRRLLGNGAGRARTSFSCVRREAAHATLPLLLTGILRLCIALFRAIFLVFPGILYLIRTAFYDVVIICEGETMRAALRRSSQVTRKRTWRTLKYFAVFGIVLYLPLFVLIEVLARIAELHGLTFLLAIDFGGAVLGSIAYLLFLLSSILLFREFTQNTNT